MTHDQAANSAPLPQPIGIFETGPESMAVRDDPQPTDWPYSGWPEVDDSKRFLDKIEATLEGEYYLAAYGAAQPFVRNLGTETIRRQGKAGMQAYEALFSASTTPRFEINDQSRHTGTHNAATNTIMMNTVSINKQADNIAGLRNEGLQISDSTAKLIAHLHVLGHEVGHSISSHLGDRPLTAYSSIRYLRQHPEEALTGNATTDALTQEERFAEGFARVVVDEVLRSMDFSKRDRTKVLDYLRHSPPVDGAESLNQIDYLQLVTHDKSLKNLVQESYDRRIAAAELAKDEVLAARLREEKEDSHHANNDGLPGYRLPLNIDELVTQINATTPDKIARETVISGDPEWMKTVQGVRKNRKVRRYLGELAQKRANALDPEATKRESARKTKFLSAVSVLTAAGVILTVDVSLAYQLGQIHPDSPQDSPAVERNKTPEEMERLLGPLLPLSSTPGMAPGPAEVPEIPGAYIDPDRQYVLVPRS
jgi:hypothetical protein